MRKPLHLFTRIGIQYWRRAMPAGRGAAARRTCLTLSLATREPALARRLGAALDVAFETLMASRDDTTLLPGALAALMRTARDMLLDDLAADRAQAGPDPVRPRTLRGASGKLDEAGEAELGGFLAGEPEPGEEVPPALAALLRGALPAVTQPKPGLPSRTAAATDRAMALHAAEMVGRLRRMGLPAREAGRGRWEVVGAPKRLMAAWSGRGAEVRDAAAAKLQPLDDLPEGRRRTELKRKLLRSTAEQTRRAKAAPPDRSNLAALDRRAFTGGLTPEAVLAGMRTAELSPPPIGASAKAAARERGRRAAVVTRRQFRTAVAEQAVARGLSVSQLNAEVEGAIARGEVVALGVAGGRGDTMLSTPAAIETERAMLAAARAGRGNGLLRPQMVHSAMNAVTLRQRAEGNKGFALSEEQQAFVAHFARGDAVVTAEGLAGTGKTTVMSVVVSMAQQAGLNVIGVAPTNKAAKKLHAETNTDEQPSLQKLAWQLRTGRRSLTARDYVLVDEAGMAALSSSSTRTASTARARRRISCAPRTSARSCRPTAPWPMCQAIRAA